MLLLPLPLLPAPYVVAMNPAVGRGLVNGKQGMKAGSETTVNRQQESCCELGDFSIPVNEISSILFVYWPKIITTSNIRVVLSQIRCPAINQPLSN